MTSSGSTEVSDPGVQPPEVVQAVRAPGRRASLRVKLMLLMVGTTAATLLVAVLMVGWVWRMQGAERRAALEAALERALEGEVRELHKQWGSEAAAAALAPERWTNWLVGLQERLSRNSSVYGVSASGRVVQPQVLTARSMLVLQQEGGAELRIPETAGDREVNELSSWNEGTTNRLALTVSGNEFTFTQKLMGKGGSRTEGIVRVRLRLDDAAERTILLGALGIVVAVSILTGWLLSSRLEPFISRPITQLAQTMLRVTEVKDYSPRLRHGENDEIGDLVKGFNAMLAAVEQRDAALQEAQQKLEERVEQRTRALRSQVAERERAEKALSQQLARIGLLNQITHAISDRQDIESILSVVLSELSLKLPVDFGCALLLDAGCSELKVACCRERELDTAFLAWKVEDWSVPLAGSGWETPEDGPEFFSGDLSGAARKVFAKPAQLGMRVAGALPLRYERRLMGILVVARRQDEPFTTGEQEFLAALADHVALAGHQARLYAELQKAYNELRQTQQTVMQHERLRALGQMASGIAHDINNALSPVSGFAELLLATEKGLGANAQKYLQHIKTASDDVAHIVSRLREFYRNRNEQQPHAPVAVQPLIEGVVELTRPRWRDLAQQKGVDIQVLTDLTPEPLLIEGVEPELREALTNLLFNALDAMPNGGTVALRSRKVNRVPGAAPDAAPTHVIIEVIDSGVGMDEDTRKRCFEPFFSTKGRRGTGLGLAMVFGTMQRHAGTIEIESEPGRGTTMRLVFPAAAATEVVRKEPAPVEKLRSLVVLFVDDEPLLRELIRELLETEGHKVVTADGGVEGVATFKRMVEEGRKPDVVITDLGMPQLDGRAVATQVKGVSPETPVIMMTGWGKMMRGGSEVRAPVDALVSKPPQMAELTAAMHKVLSSKP